MTVPRREQICPEETLYYHCTSRCVRRAYLYGPDPLTGKDHSHRKQWILSRLKLLGEVFCIDLCAYAVMSNHYHLVLRLAPEKAESLSQEEVITRWCTLYKGNALAKRFRAGEILSEPEQLQLEKLVAQWRSNLSNISKYMQALNEPIARRSNAEDDCKGRFWEGRFKSQAILDEVGLLACMAYVDLNPYRAGVTQSPLGSTDISLHDRLKVASEASSKTNSTTRKPSDSKRPALLPFGSGDQQERHDFDPCQAVLPCTLADYLGIIDWLGKRRKAKSQAKNQFPHSFQLSIDPQALLTALQPGSLSKGTSIGQPVIKKEFVRRQRHRRTLASALRKAA